MYSSTIIENITAYCESDPNLVVAYFYFDFNDKGKQIVGDLLGSLIAQLAAQLTELPQGLDALYLKSQSGQHRPNVNDLLVVLKEVTVGPHQVYVAIDALDECTEREELLQMIEHATSWKSGNLHLITTSRRERDLEEVLQGLVTSCICIQNAAVDADIERHVSERLTQDFRLRKWSLAVREDIKATLVRGANGMYVRITVEGVDIYHIPGPCADRLGMY
jgi:ankyrin repeat domain-containing protein 50